MARIRWCERIAAAIGMAAALTWIASPAQAGLLDVELRGLAWSAAEVNRATDAESRRLLETARRDHELGCRTHCEAIDTAWRRLLAAARVHIDAEALPDWSLTVVQSAQIDACATPGGSVVLSEAFVRERQLDGPQLAFVIAHEMAHVLHQHERQVLTAALALLPRQVPWTVADTYTEMNFNPSLVRSIDVVMHQTEFEADETGLYLAALAGYPPDALLRFLDDEAAAKRPDASFVSTHPSAAARARQAHRHLPLLERLARHAAELAGFAAR